MPTLFSSVSLSTKDSFIQYGIHVWNIENGTAQRISITASSLRVEHVIVIGKKREDSAIKNEKCES